MKKKNITCIVCPIGCNIEVEYDPETEEISKMEGNTCIRGKDYVRKELFNPERVLTSSIKVKGGKLPLVSIRTDKDIPKEKILSLMEIINQQEVKAPVHIGDVLVSNPLDLNADIIATKSVEKN